MRRFNVSWRACAAGLVGVVVGLAGCAPRPLPAISGKIYLASFDLLTEVSGVQVLNPASGRIDDLWRFDGLQIKSWRVAPDGLRAAYLLSGVPAGSDSSLVVRDLAPDAPPIEVAMTTGREAAIQGVLWSADGRRLAYGKQVGELNVKDIEHPVPAEAWELHVVDLDLLARGAADADRVVWRIAGDASEPFLYELLAWDSAGERAAIGMRHGRLLYAHNVRRVNTATGETIGDTPTHMVPYPDAASPDGRQLALPESRWPGAEPELPADLPGAGPVAAGAVSSDSMRRLELATGVVAEIAARPEQELAWPVWSPGAEQLAWLEVQKPRPTEMPRLSASGETAIPPTALPPLDIFVRIADVSDGAEQFVQRAANTGDRVVAYSPDGSLVAIGLSGAITRQGGQRVQHPDAVRIYAVEAGEKVVEWRLPEDVFAFSWVER